MTKVTRHPAVLNGTTSASPEAMAMFKVSATEEMMTVLTPEATLLNLARVTTLLNLARVTTLLNLARVATLLNLARVMKVKRTNMSEALEPVTEQATKWANWLPSSLALFTATPKATLILGKNQLKKITIATIESIVHI